MNKTIYSAGRTRSRPPRIFAIVSLLIGLGLGVGGVRLVTLGGSFYYVIAGLALIASGVMLWRGNRWGSHNIFTDSGGSVANFHLAQVDECSTLQQLEQVVSRLLRSVT